ALAALPVMRANMAHAARAKPLFGKRRFTVVSFQRQFPPQRPGERGVRQRRHPKKETSARPRDRLESDSSTTMIVSALFCNPGAIAADRLFSPFSGQSVRLPNLLPMLGMAQPGSVGVRSRRHGTVGIDRSENERLKPPGSVFGTTGQDA